MVRRAALVPETGRRWRLPAEKRGPAAEPLRPRPTPSRPRAGKKRWVGVNEWQGLPAIRVALGVRSEALVAWVLDRMGR